MSNYRYRSKFLRPLKRKSFLKDFTVFDIETERWPDQAMEGYHNKRIIPFLLVYFDGAESSVYSGKDCVSDFLRAFLVHKNRNRVVFSHNGGKFDMIALYECFVSDPFFYEKFSYQPIMQGSRIMSFKIKDKDRHLWEFRDSFSLLPRSLDSLCRSFKPDHVKLEMPCKSFACDPSSWVTYCENDCFALFDILSMFNSIISDVEGCVGYTIASTSLKTFRKKFLKTDLATYYSYNDFFRRSYYGGRSEVFCMLARECDGPFYVYDINSMYPFVMKEYRYPVSKPFKISVSNVFELRDRCGVAIADVSAPDTLHIPVLPYHRDDGKLVFPLGSWRGMYEFSLLVKAAETGYKVNIRGAWEFDTDYLFRDFVDYFYRLKNNSEGAEREIYKLILNSLYGKWGERSERNEIISDPDVNLIGLYPFDTVFGYVIKKSKNVSAYHLPVISIRVTSLAQLHLYKFFEEIIGRGGKIYYCDTDSIVTDIRLPCSDRLGDIKLEESIRRGVFLAPKTYYLELFDNEESKVRIKGFTDHIRDRINNWDIWYRALVNNDFSPFFEEKIRPASLNEIRIRHLDGFVTLLENKSIKTMYDKREVLENFDTRPFYL